jgi:hypothetical protein
MAEFQRGHFVRYRATTDIHLLERVMKTEEECEFDGMELRWDGDKHTLPAMKGAVRDGWLVPADDTESTYVPKPADIKVGPADAAGADRESRMRLETAVEDEQLVGSVASSRAKTEAAEKRPPKRAAGKRAPKAKRTAPADPPTKKKFRVEAHESQEAVPIAKLSNPAKQTPVIKDGAAAQREIRRLDNAQGHTPVKVERLAKARKQVRQKVASGDVEEAITGEELPDLLPEALSTEKPKPGVRSDKDFSWNIRRPWRTRLKEALVLAESNPGAFKQVLKVETVKMKHHIRTALAKKAKEKAKEEGGED